MAIEIVTFPIHSMVIFHSYVCLLPEGNEFWSEIRKERKPLGKKTIQKPSKNPETSTQNLESSELRFNQQVSASPGTEI